MFNSSTIAPNNETDHIIDDSFNFERNPSLVYVTIACACTGLWIVFITFYNSRLLGFIVTKVLSKFYSSNGYIHIGSFSVSIISGKVMFRDVHYITKDYSIHIVDGTAIFKWWLPYDISDLSYYRKIKKDEDISNTSRCRLNFYLNGLVFHLYNRYDLYQNIHDILKCERYGDAGTTFSDENHDKEEQESISTEATSVNKWRDLFPIIKVNIRSGKLVVGNRLLETTLWVYCNHGHATYSMPDASSTLDYFTHFIQCKCSDVRILLSNSPGYKGVVSEPPSFMGDGFVVLQSKMAKISYFQDEPGVVPGDVDASSESDPEWGLDIAFTKGAKIKYGPWVDRQRNAIQKYFFPSNFQEMSVTKPAESSEHRVHSGFDVNVEFSEGTTVDMLFTKNEETSAIHIVCSDCATFHYYQPWVVNEYGYSNNIVARFQQIEVFTSMSFQKLIQCELIEIVLNITIPRMWNCFQRWTCELWFVKTTCYFIDDHKNFINGLMNDWSSSQAADIAKFVPYEWEFHLYFRDFELILLVNQYNLIDCTNENENNELALCGETLDITFVLSFTQFQPETVKSKFFFRGETVILRNFLPDSNTLRQSVIALSRNSNHQLYPLSTTTATTATTSATSRHFESSHNESTAGFDEIDGSLDQDMEVSKGWRQRTGKSSHWIDVWSVPVLILNLYYRYHPLHLEDANISNKRYSVDYLAVDPAELAPDVMTVELEAGPSAVKIFGTFWRQFFVGFKSNYFGSSQAMHEYNAMKPMKDPKLTTRTPSHASTPPKEEITSSKDMRAYRPFEANVTVVLSEIQAELSMHTYGDTASPVAFCDRITFEMHKTFKETRLQLIISPISVITNDSSKRSLDHSHLSKGFLALSGFQFRGHAMFSDKDVSLGGDTVEYAWLTEIGCGSLTGKVTPLQIYSLMLWAETFMLHIQDEENIMINPNPIIMCPHNENQVTCGRIAEDQIVCPSENDLKYSMFRFSLETVDVHLAETECSCNIQASPIRFATCNSTSHDALQGSSFLISEISVRQYIQQLNYGADDSYSQFMPSHSNSWVEVGVISLGPITADIKETGKDELQLRNQMMFLKLHDEKSKRLWFLWDQDHLESKIALDRCRRRICGCIGGCNFFDANINGVRFFTNETLETADVKSMLYDSTSLWGDHTDIGAKEHKQKRRPTSYIGSSFQNKSTILSSKTSSGGDTVDICERSSSFLAPSPNPNTETASKYAFGRSHSLLHSDISQMSLKRTSSDATFYSCKSGAEDVGRSRSTKRRSRRFSRASAKSNESSISYVSAMSSADDFLDEIDSPVEHLNPLVKPGLLIAYTNYMQPVTCINWRQNIPSNFRRKFSLSKNLKVMCPSGCLSNVPNKPSFNPNMQGKLPFDIVSDKEESTIKRGVSLADSEVKSHHQDSTDKKSFIAIKLHQKISLVMTPLLIQALDRYLSSFSPVKDNYHVLHTLDSLHSGCISNSKNQFLESNLVDFLITKRETDLPLGILEPMRIAAYGVEVPEIDIIFFQIASEMYTPSEQSSLSGQCGSEYSDCDIKNTDCVLMAAKLSNLDVNIHTNLQDPILYNSCIVVEQKSSIHMITDELKSKLSSPSERIFNGNLDYIHTQVLYLGGNNEKEVSVTCIPKAKTNIDFYVRCGDGRDDDDDDSKSITDSRGKDNLGNIIFEGGIDEITVRSMLQTKLNPKLVLSESDKLTNNNDITPKKTVKVTNDTDCTIVEVLDEEMVSDCNTEAFSRMNSAFDSCSTIDSFDNHIPQTRKGYTSLDVDSGDFADTSDLDSDNGHVSIASSTRTNVGNTVRFSKKTASKKGKEIKKEIKKDPVVLKEMSGYMNLKSVWINLAAPTHLKNIHYEDMQNLNVVTVFVPALSCWIPPLVDVMSTLEKCTSKHTIWKRSVLACFMGQALPDDSLVKKHNVCSTLTDMSQFLQEEYSSRLVYAMRNYSLGHHLHKIMKAVRSGSFIPDPDDLLTGIHALARQWKCVIIGAEVPENTFGRSQETVKRPVVGRGQLTEKDLSILSKSNHLKVSKSPSLKSQQNDNMPLLPEDTEYVISEQSALLVHSNSEEEKDRRSRIDTNMEKHESLYDWMSKSPSSAMSGNLQRDGPPIEMEMSDQIDSLSIEKFDKIQTLDIDMLRSTSPMISVPTSGMQLAQAAQVFNSIFSVVGIQVGAKEHAQTSSKGRFALDRFQINLIDAEVSDEVIEDSEPTLPAFSLEKLELNAQGNEEKMQVVDYTPSVHGIDVVRNDLKFIVDVKQVHQHLDFKFVRLLLQTTETLHVVEEQKKFAEKTNQNNFTENVHKWKGRKTFSSTDLKDMPKCWRNMYNVMNLYKVLPNENLSLRDVASPTPLLRRQSLRRFATSTHRIKTSSKHLSKGSYSSDMKDAELCRLGTTLCISGMGTLRKAKLTASISGLDLDFEMRHINVTYIKEKKELINNDTGGELMSSLSAHLNKLSISLTESLKENKTLLTCKVYKSHALHTVKLQPSNKHSKRSLLAIGRVAVEIPQHPGALRNIIAQFTARLQTHYMEFNDYRMSRSNGNEKIHESSTDVTSTEESNLSISTSTMFRVTSSGIHVLAALLPSLNAEYKIDKVTGWGSNNGKVKFFFHLPTHILSFATKVQVVPLSPTTHISLPPIKVEGHHLLIHPDNLTSNTRSHAYLQIEINIGILEQNLSSDLLNHLIFLQKGFAKEVNDVVADVETNEPIALWKSKSESTIATPQLLIYSVKLKLQSISITATTPSSNGVRLETGEVLFELSNLSPSSSVLSSPNCSPTKMYGKANVNLSFSLGQFNKAHYLGNDQDLTVFARFGTSLGLRNSAQESGGEFDSERETIFISLDTPQLFVMPAAVDKGVLVYLHYKNAYQQWMIQRSALSSEYSTVAEHIFKRFPAQQNAEPNSYLLLQVNISDLGICIPLKDITVLPMTPSHGLADDQPGTALLITVAETLITCCNSGSFVSTGLFRTFCLRFADNFDHMKEYWSIEEDDIMNTCIIPEGSYEVCSREVTRENKQSNDTVLPGKWVMTLFWKMRGVEINMDVHIGKRLNKLTNVLTAITGESDVADLSSLAEAEDNVNEEMKGKPFHDEDGIDEVDTNSPTPYLRCSSSLERQLSFHTQKVDQLRRTNANPKDISKEVQTLQEIEAVLSNQFINDMKKKFRRKSTVRKSSKLPFQKRSRKSTRRSPPRAFSQYEYVNNDMADQEVFDAVDAPRVPEFALYDPTRERPSTFTAFYGSDYNKDDYLDVVINKDTEKRTSHVKFTDSSYDVRSEISPALSQAQSSVSATALNFEFNVVIDIDSGKCTFHTAENEIKEEEHITVNRENIDRRHSDQSEGKDKKMSQHSYHKNVRATVSIANENAVLLIPGVTTRVHYLSTYVVDKSVSCPTDSAKNDASTSRSGSSVNKQLNKIADLNALVLIQSISKETVVKPSLLDFLENALEPIIEFVEQPSESESNEGTESMLSSSGSSLYSFPVNVSVLIRIDPSDIRFSCHPISKVECLLRIPSLDFAITNTGSPSSPPKSVSPRKKQKDFAHSSSSSSIESDISSGFCFTLCLSRFSFCIFHPYGSQYGSTTDSRLNMKASNPDFKRDGRPQNPAISGRKDALSLNVEFIKFNLFRKTTKIPLEQLSSVANSNPDYRTEVGISAICDIGSAYFNYDMRRLNEILDVPKAWYKRGLVQRIFLGKEGSYATQTSVTKSRNYSSERSSLIDPISFSERTVSDLELHQSLKPGNYHKKGTGLSSHRRAISGGSSFFSSLMSPFPTPRSSTIGSRKDIAFSFDASSRTKSSISRLNTNAPLKRVSSKKSSEEHQGSFFSQSSSCSEWETKVVTAFKVSRVDVSANMQNVMGKAMWSINDLNSSCNVLLNNVGKRVGAFNLSIHQNSMEAQGGVIGLYAELLDIKTDCIFKENLGELPHHSATVCMKNCEFRLEYMSSNIIMAILSLFKAKMGDTWIIPSLIEGSCDESSKVDLDPSNSGSKKTEVQLACDVCWDELQLIISRSTTPDIIKVMAKLEAFFDQQHRSSVRALSTLKKRNRSSSYLNVASPVKEPKEEVKVEHFNGLKYQHWMEILNGLYGIKFKNMAVVLPDKNIALGGKLSLYGNFVSMACFHGNFRSPNWGLFTMRGLSVKFTTNSEAVEKSCQVMRGHSVHEASLELGHTPPCIQLERKKSLSKLQDFMAIVRKVSRGRCNPPKLGAHVQEWVEYVNTISDYDLPSGPSPTHEMNSEKFSHTKVTNSIRKVSFAPKFRYENESDVIFALPRLSLELKTNHDLPMSTVIVKSLRIGKKVPVNLQFPTVPNPHTVDTLFISHFDDSLLVNVSLLLYLRDLILNYMKEKETSVTVRSSGPQHRSKSLDVSNTPTPKMNLKKMDSVSKAEAIKKEEKYRHFRNQGFKLDPGVSVLTWAGGRCDPIGFDWVLEKLGFMHSGSTIPKWLQRGVLDQMDVMLAKLMEQLLSHMVKNEEENHG